MYVAKYMHEYDYPGHDWMEDVYEQELRPLVHCAPDPTVLLSAQHEALIRSLMPFRYEAP